MEIPRPRTADERVFVSCYRHDSIRGFIVKFAFPALGILCLVAFPWLAWNFYESFSADMKDEIRERLIPLLWAQALLGVTTGIMFFFLASHMKKRFYDTFVIYNDEEIIHRSGDREIRCRWEEIGEMKTRRAGRVQTATLVFPGGKMTFDSGMIDNSGPRPQLKSTLRGEILVYPNGNVQPLKIEENELYGVIQQKLASRGEA